MYTFNSNILDIPRRHIYKLLFVMRLTTVIIIASMLQVSASSFGQKLNYVRENVTLIQLFKEIKQQIGYKVVWTEEDIKANTYINANFRNTPIEEVLDKSLRGLNLTHTIKNKTIVIKATPLSFLERIKATFSAMNVRGRVVDDQNQPLSGAVVKVKGGGNATSTTANGEFMLKGVDESSILVISYIGYETKEIAAVANIGTITLTLAVSNLKQVEVNAGYYTVKARDLTGSISTVTAATIDKQPINNPLQAIQNRVTGLEITQLTGVPGGGFRVQIRGRNSIQNGTDPLYIVDGVIYSSLKLNTASSNNITQDASPLSMINPYDIENIEVLKDADATAIYGSRGANGVILITTKKGTIGKVKVNANISQGFSQVGHKMELMNTEEYFVMRMEALKNDGLTIGTTDYDINGTWDKNKYTNWQDILIGGKANVTNASLTISGGTTNSNYLISGNYYGEGSVFPGSFGFRRGGVHGSVNFGSAESRLKATFSANYNYSISNLIPIDPTSSILLAPNYPDSYDEFGKLSWSYNGATLSINPRAALLNTIEANTDNLIGNANLSYKIIENLVIKASVGYTTTKRDELYKSPLTAQSPFSNPSAATRQSRFGNNFNNSWILEPQLNYNVNLGAGKLSALVGMSFQKNSTQYRDIQATNFNSDELMDNISSASAFRVLESTFATYKYAAIFSRLNYSLLDKYFFNITGRRDASSRFGSENQFANFGALGAAWIFSEEGLIKKSLPFLSFGKIRASYGITGNDQILDYQHLQLYNSGAPYQGTSTLVTTRIANPDYGWETNKKAEFAMELGFLKDRINMQIAFFRNRSSNQLILNALPPSVGSSGIIGNLPATVQNTGLEFESTFKLFSKKDLDWSIGLNLTIPKNKLLSYPGLATSGNRTKFMIGKSLNIRRFYNTYVDPQTGLYAFEDRDGNGVQSEADIYLDKFVGQFFYGGFQNTIRYKQLTFDFLISFSKQNGNSYLNGLPGLNPGYFERGLPVNMPTAILERWQQIGDQTSVTKFTALSSRSTNLFLGTSTTGAQSIADNSYARLKNISLSYSLPAQWLSKFQISGLQFNIQGQNIFTITKYEGLDPENQLITRLPPLRTLSLGLKLTL